MIPTVLHGGATTGTTSVPSRKPLPTVLCRCLQAPHRCGDVDRFQTTGLTSVGSFNNLSQIVTGKFGYTAHSPFLMKLLASARLIKAATTKHEVETTALAHVACGSTCIGCPIAEFCRRISLRHSFLDFPMYLRRQSYQSSFASYCE